jgi:hypothetical protein
MSNNIAFDENREIVHSHTIFNLRNNQKRVNAREESYSCPHCKTEMTYAHSGSIGCFKHMRSTSQDEKDDCPYYSGLLTGCSKEIAIAIEMKKNEVQAFLELNNITGYKVISYYSEPKLVKYIQKYPDEDFIMVGNMITNWEYEQLEKKELILRKKALAKYLSSNKKNIVQTFVGTEPDKIFTMKYSREYFSNVVLHPHLLSIDDLKTKDFSGRGRLMEKYDISETRKTTGHHDNRSLNNNFKH